LSQPSTVVGETPKVRGSPPETGSLLVRAQYLLLAFFGVAVGGRVFAALASAGVTEIFLLAVGSEAIFDESSLPQ
jgi:hypothetical protein